MADWTSLPADLINRIADRLLATDDLYYYMDLRAVCRGWRCSTADPNDENHSSGRRFLPRQWALLDEVQVHQSDDDRLFVNPSTGRFVRKHLPLLRRRYHLVAGAVGGSLVLAERSAPHAVRLLNPFTGSLTRFAAPLPYRVNVVVADLVIDLDGCSLPTLVLFCDIPDTIHWADSGSHSFSSYEDEDQQEGNFFKEPPVRQALVGGIYAAARARGTVSSSLVPPEAVKILTTLVTEQFADYFKNAQEQDGNRCFLVESAGDILVVFKLPHHGGIIGVFKIGDNMAVQPVKSIGRRALFVGDSRCLSVDADKFASVDANSIYYVHSMPSSDDGYDYDVRVYSLGDGTDLCAGGAIGSQTYFPTNDSPPFSVVQLLSCYAYESPCSQLGWEQMIAHSFSTMDEDVIAIERIVWEIADSLREIED